MDIKITDLPLKTAPLGNADLFEVSESQGAGVFVSKKIAGNQFVGPQGPQGPQGVPGPVGPIGLFWQGSWSASGTYNINDAVGFGGASYFCINPVGPSVSNPATDTTNWALLAAQGATGPQGPQGIQGPAGASSSFAYEIGQYVAAKGGIIFHRWLSTTAFGVPESGIVQNYLVVDTVDLGGAQWGLDGINVGNCESTWDGFTNTANMIAAGAAVGTAAQLCNASTNNGQNDWYLPAIDELSMIFNNRFLINLNQGVVPGFNPLGYNNYWSSTQLNDALAFTLFFVTSDINFTPKLNYLSVRAVRRFSI
jgi:hypothetical protein